MTTPNCENHYKTIGKYSVVIIPTTEAKEIPALPVGSVEVTIPYKPKGATPQRRSSLQRKETTHVNHVKSQSLSRSRDIRRSIRRMKRDALCQQIEAAHAVRRSMSLRRALSQKLIRNKRKCDGWYLDALKNSQLVGYEESNVRPRIQQRRPTRTPSYYERTMRRSRELQVQRSSSPRVPRSKSLPQKCTTVHSTKPSNRLGGVTTTFQGLLCETSKRNIRMKGPTYSGNRRLAHGADDVG